MSDKPNPITPAPARLVIRPFDVLSAQSKLVLPANVATGRNTTGVVIATHHGAQSIMCVSKDSPHDFDEEVRFISVGDQVIFPAMSGTEINLPEPKPDDVRFMQTYIVIREADVIAKIESDEHVKDVTAEPRTYAST